MPTTKRFTIRTMDGIALQQDLDIELGGNVLENYEKLQVILNRLADYEDRYISLNDLSEDVHQNAVDHGWWDEPRSFGEVIALCHSELSEALEEYRAGRPNVWFACEEIKSDPHVCDPKDEWECTEYHGQADCKHRGSKPEGVAVEMIDCIIRILDWCGKEGVDVDALLAMKHEYNKTRPYKHGGKKI